MNYTWTFAPEELNDSFVMSHDQTYIKESMTLADAGNYTCNATSEMGTADATAMLFETVNLPGQQAEFSLTENAPIVGLSAVIFVIFMIITALLVQHARLKNRNKVRHEAAGDNGES